MRRGVAVATVFLDQFTAASVGAPTAVAEDDVTLVTKHRAAFGLAQVGIRRPDAHLVGKNTRRSAGVLVGYLHGVRPLLRVIKIPFATCAADLARHTQGLLAFGLHGRA